MADRPVVVVVRSHGWEDGLARAIRFNEADALLVSVAAQ